MGLRQKFTAATTTTTTNYPHLLVRATDRAFAWPESQGPVSTVSCMGRGAAGTHASCGRWGARMDGHHQSRPPHHNLDRYACGVPRDWAEKRTRRRKKWPPSPPPALFSPVGPLSTNASVPNHLLLLPGSSSPVVRYLLLPGVKQGQRTTTTVQAH